MKDTYYDCLKMIPIRQYRKLKAVWSMDAQDLRGFRIVKFLSGPRQFSNRNNHSEAVFLYDLAGLQIDSEGYLRITEPNNPDSIPAFICGYADIRGNLIDIAVGDECYWAADTHPAFRLNFNDCDLGVALDVRDKLYTKICQFIDGAKLDTYEDALEFVMARSMQREIDADILKDLRAIAGQ